MNVLACPKCHQRLIRDGHSYRCINNHNYDLSKRGYLNLLLNPDKRHNNPGDSKESLEARKAFLDKGYYDPILDACLTFIKEHETEHMQILDLGCGEGYYTKRLKDQLGENHTYYGLDISKEAINMATRYDRHIYWLVGNSKNIPLLDQSLDYILALFTVVNSEEIKRVLKKNGYMIHVTANKNHLIEIKKLIYDHIREKSDQFIRQPFPVIDSFILKKKIAIKNREDALNLLKMTPHYYHISHEHRDVLESLTALDVTIDLTITIYQPWKS